MATGADALSIEQLAGALIKAVGAERSAEGDVAQKRRGLLSRKQHRYSPDDRRNAGGASASGAGAQSPSGEAGAV
ncbi:hypothetical protein [Sphingopyxis sp.]|uniref:hypothetical protein n=1 Tax=Sphingopyxis sp. TaxID=1908224 RepID=UPI0025F5EB02|nr:hypothetical protein [Sphingopyxis sp.]